MLAPLHKTGTRSQAVRRVTACRLIHSKDRKEEPRRRTGPSKRRVSEERKERLTASTHPPDIRQSASVVIINVSEKDCE